MKITNPSNVDSRIVIKEEVFAIKAGDSLEVTDAVKAQVLLDTHAFLVEDKVIVKETVKIESKEKEVAVK